jgi:hypothetical protein
MLQGQPIQVKLVVEAAQRVLSPQPAARPCTPCSPDADDCRGHFCQYSAHTAVLWMAVRGDSWAIPQLSRIRALLARLRLFWAPIQTNLQLDVAYTQRLCKQSCLAT